MSSEMLQGASILIESDLRQTFQGVFDHDRTIFRDDPIEGFTARYKYDSLSRQITNINALFGGTSHTDLISDIGKQAGEIAHGVAYSQSIERTRIALNLSHLHETIRTGVDTYNQVVGTKAGGKQTIHYSRTAIIKDLKDMLDVEQGDIQNPRAIDLDATIIGDDSFTKLQEGLTQVKPDSPQLQIQRAKTAIHALGMVIPILDDVNRGQALEGLLSHLHQCLPLEATFVNLAPGKTVSYKENTHNIKLKAWYSLSNSILQVLSMCPDFSRQAMESYISLLRQQAEDSTDGEELDEHFIGQCELLSSYLGDTCTPHAIRVDTEIVNE